ncbi:acetate--CoA ligase family protein [Verticiella sediminum]|uniref:Acetate--CoA ligase family protein n=1 Tax=Verticiella sediminum TaxID=1247510 RepID=A0A556B0C1_9BURK|nr:acetate--CoA ligase family protein [Verticiella sediminum]TSH98636.1 acetate--CoA ligase family protein [Verticiella sediminum]
MSISRSLYPSRELQPLFAPASIAVVDFSSKARSFGARTVQNLAGSGARLWTVNPKLQADAGQGIYRSVQELPEVPECVVIAVPRDAVYGVAGDCARLGVKGAIVYASGYSETGAAGHRVMQERLSGLARDTGMRILGPNCIGILSEGGRLRLTFAEAPDLGQPRGASIGLVSQSGGLGLALAQAAEHGVAFSHVLTAGNSCDVDVADQVAYLAEHPDCRVIACLFEGMADPQRLLAAGRLALSQGKPVVVHKIATGEEGTRAAMSHTGSLAGSAAVYRAAFEDAGFVAVEAFEALVETAAFFAKAGRPAAHGVAALSTSGGAAIMVADAAERHRVALPQPSETAAQVLRSHIPEFGTVRNPCDMTAQILSNPGALQACARALLDDASYGALVFPNAYAYAPAIDRLATLDLVAGQAGKPVCCVWLSQSLGGPGTVQAEASAHVALFRSMDRCMATLRAWHRYDQRLRRDGTVAGRLAPPDAIRALASAANDGAATLTEHSAKRVLAAYGIPVVDECLVRSAQEAVRAARGFGGRVALKVLSADIPHKTEAGGVRLDLHGDVEVACAYEEILVSAMRYAPDAHIDGVLVQPMVRRDLELIVGGRRDPQFGPTIVVGLGGIFVELLRDSVVALAPLSPAAAREMLDQLRGRALFDGFRGAVPTDIAQLAQVIARVGEMLADGADMIEELDINPLVISDGRPIAVDALIALETTSPRRL